MEPSKTHQSEGSSTTQDVFPQTDVYCNPDLSTLTSTVSCHTEESHSPSLSPQSFMKPAGQSQTEFVILDQNGQLLQCERMVIVTGQSEGREVFVIPSNQLAGSQVLLPRSQSADIATATVTTVSDDEHNSNSANNNSLTTVSPPAKTLPAEQPASGSPGVFTPPLKALPSDVPIWALRLRDAEQIGDSYRGYCSTDSELEAVLLLHKQATGGVFGTRQSPSPAKPATRLMWKSQYVPYDGVPFVNAGSRAIVMECQYGPRRKGLQPKKSSQQDPIDYKATCPARIYVKKVRKFPEYRVSADPRLDRKLVRMEQEKAFSTLRKKLWDTGGVLRYYLQLPTEKAHLYHDTGAPIPPPPPDLPLPPRRLPEQEQEEEEEEEEDVRSIPSRLHPRVVEKIRELVEEGHAQVYSVRKQLRKFVEREMFGSEGVPERHNLCYFPTVNDIRNHMHETQKALQGTNIEVTLCPPQWTVCDNPLNETVTLTLTPAPTEAAGGLMEVDCSLCPEATQLCNSLTCLQPKIFAQLQDGLRTPPHPPSPPSSSGGHPSLRGPLAQGSTPPQPGGPSYPLGEALGLGDCGAVLGLGPVVHVSVMEGGGGGGGEGSHHIVLENGQTIPVQIVHSAALSVPEALPGMMSEEVEEQEEEEEEETTVEVNEEVIAGEEDVSAVP